MFQFFRIILLMFGKSRLYVIAKGMRAVIDVSFFVTFVLPFVTFFVTFCYYQISKLF